MSLTAFILIISSATLHATWNLIAKKSKATLPFYAATSTTATLIWAHCQFWTPVKLTELPPLFWLMVAGSVTSDTIYALGLIRCYRTMDMSSAYPMMRSLPLLLTAGVTAALGIGKALTLQAAIGMGIVFCGCLMIPLAKFSDFKLSHYLNRNTLFLLTVACGTTGYTIFDSQAQAVMRSTLPEIHKPLLSMTYYSTRGLLLALVLWLIIFSLKNERQNLADIISRRDLSPFLAGLAASGTYILVLFAMNYVSNVSYVQVFRQLGLVLGVAAGIFILKEKCTLPKIAGVTLIITGLILSVL